MNQSNNSSLDPAAATSTISKDVWTRATASTETPLPAWAFAGGLLASYPLAVKNSAFRPARGSIIGFGLTSILGGYMVHDGDLTNGAGFVSVWSALYLLVNGKAAIKRLRPLPIGLAGLAGFNTIYYGKRFFFPGKSPNPNPGPL